MEVKFFATYRDVTGCKSVDVPDQKDVLALIGYLSERWPVLKDKLMTAEGEIGKDAVIMVNGRHIVHLHGLETLLYNADKVAIFPVVAGG